MTTVHPRLLVSPQSPPGESHRGSSEALPRATLGDTEPRPSTAELCQRCTNTDTANSSMQEKKYLFVTEAVLAYLW